MRPLWVAACAALLLAAGGATEAPSNGAETPQDGAGTPQDGAETPQDDAGTGPPHEAPTAGGDAGEDDVRVETDDEGEETAEQAAWKYDKNDILVLNTGNFDRAIDSHDALFVVFHTPACAQCIQLHPHFVTAWKALQARQADVQFAKIDCTNVTSLLIHYGITQFPTLTFFKQQKEKMYDGGYRAVDIEAWVTKRMGDPALPIESVEQLEAAREQNSVVAVGFFRDPESVSNIIYTRVADAVHDYPFFVVVDQAIFEHYGVEDDAVVVFKQFDDGRADFPAGDYVADDLMSFLRLETFPLVSELNIDNVWRVTEEANVIKTHFLVFRNSSDPSGPQNIQDVVLPAAKKYKGDILFLLVDMADRRMFHMEEFFGVHRDHAPAMRIFRYEGPTYKFRPTHEDGTISEQQVLQFCDDFKTGKLKAFKLEQPLPEDWDAAPVKVLTAQNYATVTLDPDRHVFVMLYAPWCPHCQLVEPIFEQLAELYQPHSDVITLAKMDATANEVDDLEFQSFPTFYLYSPDGARQQFNGSRILPDFIAFLSEHTAVRLDEELAGGADGATCADGDDTCGAEQRGPTAAGGAEAGSDGTAERTEGNVQSAEDGEGTGAAPGHGDGPAEQAKDEL